MPITNPTAESTFNFGEPLWNAVSVDPLSKFTSKVDQRSVWLYNAEVDIPKEGKSTKGFVLTETTDNDTDNGKVLYVLDRPFSFTEDDLKNMGTSSRDRLDISLDLNTSVISNVYSLLSGTEGKVLITQVFHNADRDSNSELIALTKEIEEKKSKRDA